MTDSNHMVVKKDSKGEALLIMDMISDFKFEDGEKLFEPALAAAAKIAQLKKRARQAGASVIYVNDNYGRWNEDFGTFVDRTMNSSHMGREIVEKLEPEHDDLFIIKPQRSGFYATPLGVLLLSKNISRVTITGVTTDICVLFTAHDAYMRGFNVQVPSDGTAAVETEHHTYALEFMKRVADANVKPCESIEFGSNGNHRNGSPNRSMDTFSTSKLIFSGA
ncbi:MAG: isochorismatase family cysteine hydrolase [Pyrinomonadaceae bacterium]